jgi:hypothetical protein
MLSVRLLGAPQLTLDGRAIKLTRRKSRALMYYLAAHAQPLTRDHLLAFFLAGHAQSRRAAGPADDAARFAQIARRGAHGRRRFYRTV